MIEVSHKQEPWYVFIAPKYFEEDRLMVPLLVRWHEQVVQGTDPMTAEDRLEYQYHAAKVTLSVEWPISETDLLDVIEAARPELEQRAQNAEALEEEFHD